MKGFILFLIFVNGCASLSLPKSPKLLNNPIKVAVIDTGLENAYRSNAHLCPDGHLDLTGEGLEDTNGHGTNITGLIVKNAPGNHYCLIIIKAYTSKNEYLTRALEYAYKLKVDIITLSSGGPVPNDPEREIVQKILNEKITLIVAAGNNKRDLDENCMYYPACYDERIHVVGGPESYSNRGRIVDTIVEGAYQRAFGHTYSGTSQSTAILTGKFLNKLENIRKK